MDANTLMAAMVFNTLGVGMLMYAKRAANLVALVSGVGLFVIPFVVTNLLWMSVTCLALTALPFVWRRG